MASSLLHVSLFRGPKFRALRVTYGGAIGSGGAWAELGQGSPVSPNGIQMPNALGLLARCGFKPTVYTSGQMT